MKVVRIVVVLAGGLFVSPLVSALDSGSSDGVKSQVAVNYDKFKKETSYVGSPIQIMKPGDYYWHEILLRAYKKDGTAPSGYQIYIDTHYTAPRYIAYSQAYDAKGTRLSISKIDHEVVSCNGNGQCVFEEVFAINVSKAYLQSHASVEAIEFKIEGNGDYMTFQIDGAYVKNFLDAVKNKKPSD